MTVIRVPDCYCCELISKLVVDDIKIVESEISTVIVYDAKLSCRRVSALAIFVIIFLTLDHVSQILGHADLVAFQAIHLEAATLLEVIGNDEEVAETRKE